MCGPSGSEKSLQSSSQNFASTLQNNYGTLFGKQQNVLDSINSSLNPILANGPSQNGFSGALRSALDTQAINASGAAAKNAQQAARTYGAGQGGGGTSGLTSGIQKQIQASVASQSANQLATQQGQIAQADAAQGNQNYWRAQGGMDALASGYSPNGAQTGAINENQESFGQAGQITKENNAVTNDIVGFATSLAGMGAKFATGGLAGLGASAAGASQPGAFFQGGLSALGGGNSNG